MQGIDVRCEDERDSDNFLDLMRQLRETCLCGDGRDIRDCPNYVADADDEEFDQ